MALLPCRIASGTMRAARSLCAAASIAAAIAAAPLDLFTKQQRTVLPWLTPLGRVEGTLDEIAAACVNSSTAAITLPPCTWSALLPDKYLSGCALPPQVVAGAVPNCIHFDTLAEAQAACAADTHCGGVTSQSGGVAPWEMRTGPTPLRTPTGESSYAITNPEACHGTPLRTAAVRVVAVPTEMPVCTPESRGG